MTNGAISQLGGAGDGGTIDRQRFVGEAGSILASSLDYDTVLAHLAQMIVTSMADWCAIDMLEEDGSVRRLVVAHADPAKSDVAQQLEHYVGGTDRAPDFVAALARGETFLFPDLTDEQLAAAALDDTHYQIMRDLGFRSAMIVPLLTRGRLLGAITFVCAESQRIYRQDDLALASDLSARAALAVDNARLYSDAQRVQEELRRANEAKDEFLGLVSHELRTPITTIYGGARLLQSRGETLPVESRQQILQDITGETERLRRIVEDLLVLARAEFGQDFVSEPVLVQRIIPNSVRPFAERNGGRRIECSIEPELQPVGGEATYIEQVLRNLLSNAEKYGPPDGLIEVRAEQGESEVIVRVLDEGPGIAPDEAETIFERFYRSERWIGKASGMGLGLTVCKRLVEALSGRIWARPRPTGGLEVGFALPVYPEEERWPSSR